MALIFGAGSILLVSLVILGVNPEAGQARQGASALLVAEEAVEGARRPVSQPGSSFLFEAPAVSTGQASYYGYNLAGNLTANGERFDPAGLTAAHRTLSFGARVRVTNTANDRSVVVRINDRGPFVDGRIIDVSRAAAQRLGMLQSGTAVVQMAILSE